ncbi:DUF421 domain-containing protein [Amphibacillus indicireducens]|uniref:DUF421 domain-containing protein n=1 Tax=Amphibacillus indicireducens TaxID=1076330 RepID=A0ABP7VCQ6_9BACI
MWLIVSRTFLTYGIIVLFFRLMGKREIGELSLLDIVISIMMAELAVVVIEDTSKPMYASIAPMFVLVVIQRVTARISLKSKKFRDWFEGKPSVLILNGKIDKKEMQSHRYNFDDLMLQLHEKGIKCVQDVEYAILEPSGKLSVFAKEKPESTGYVHLLIADGEIMEDALKMIDKSKQWLKAELSRQGYDQIDQIFYCTLDSANHWFINLDTEKAVQTD